ncbi:ABC transporter ATP-binding protein [Alkalihalobacillus sp. AL-G]|uniref:ABC transporter ATP-binding protein n=1 Tax=Alkalihalobacillus sp. AL-G TaxID=2926399 RepID=UPI00272A0D96|nr:ABC transporter ATP-binding protein [Alkalihalobacillus sp. AL-G]WLD95362.1 ABC transporter ATP-binding protein [Alkalihalobacillus sp. AL-G]
MEVIQLKNIKKKYGNTEVIKDTSLTIQKGEIFGLLGPSGSGKTTLIKMISGIESPSEGAIYLFKEKMPSHDLIRKIGYMAQSDGLYLDLTGLENLVFFASINGLRGNQKKNKIKEVLDLINLTGHENKLIRNYSGGMKRRLSLAVSLLHDPGVLLLDEPTVGIDPVLRQSIWDELRQLKSKGTTVLVTTHVMDEAEKCDRLAMMRNGEIIAIGSPDELKESTGSSSIEEAFLEYGGVKNEG